jgi:hypothetical protein
MCIVHIELDHLFKPSPNLCNLKKKLKTKFVNLEIWRIEFKFALEKLNKHFSNVKTKTIGFSKKEELENTSFNVGQKPKTTMRHVY